MPEMLDGRAKSIIDQAVDLFGQHRADFLDRECSGDAELRGRVESLLASMAEDDEFLHQPTINLDFSRRDEAALPQCGSSIGPYELRELIGEGGFGSVYLAEQSSPVRRQVALKIIKLGMDTRQVIARFEAERQALAMMDHPNIARVLDVGATSAGRPFFVMELVRGEHITAYCDRQRLSLAERLSLFRDVCRAVQHAHQKGVIHRDIKPSNVLITRVDGRAIVKVIDFGIAKATAGRLSDSTLHTEAHQLLGTPEYMSPEQADPTRADIDTRTDIYSLGVLLYELLTGDAPFGRQRLHAAPAAEVQRILREEEPLRPSNRWNDMADASGRFRLQTPAAEGRLPASSAIEIAERRRTEPQPLARAIRGDLDWIVLKCLEKDRGRRYETASALADDIGRHLSDEPVLATPPQAWYRLQKFMRRHRTSVLAGVITAVALIVGVAGLTVGLLQARQGQRDAKDQAEQVRSVNDFMREILTRADPETDSADVKLQDVLADASVSATKHFAGQPLQEAEVRDLLGRVFNNLSLWAKARDEFHKARQLWRDHVGPDDPRTLNAAFAHLGAVTNLSRPADLPPLLADLTPRLERVFGPDDMRTLGAHRIEAIVQMFQGREAEAERMLRDLRNHPRLTGPDGDELQIRIIHSLNSLGFRRADRANPWHRAEIYREMEPLAVERVERATRHYGAGSFFTALAQERLARILCGLGRHQEAADICHAVLHLTANRLGACHQVRAEAMDTLSRALTRLDAVREAADLRLSDVECMKQKYAMSDPVRVGSIYDALRFLDRANLAEQGEALSRELLDALTALGGGHGEMMLFAECYLAHFISMGNRLDEAEPMFHALLQREAQFKESAKRARLFLFHGHHLIRRKRFDEARKALMTAADISGDVRNGTYSTHPDDVVLGFIALFEATGDTAGLTEYKRLREEAWALATGTLSAESKASAPAPELTPPATP